MSSPSFVTVSTVSSAPRRSLQSFLTQREIAFRPAWATEKLRQLAMEELGMAVPEQEAPAEATPKRAKSRGRRSSAAAEAKSDKKSAKGRKTKEIIDEEEAEEREEEHTPARPEIDLSAPFSVITPPPPRTPNAFQSPSPSSASTASAPSAERSERRAERLSESMTFPSLSDRKPAPASLFSEALATSAFRSFSPSSSRSRLTLSPPREQQTQTAANARRSRYSAPIESAARSPSRVRPIESARHDECEGDAWAQQERTQAQAKALFTKTSPKTRASFSPEPAKPSKFSQLFSSLFPSSPSSLFHGGVDFLVRTLAIVVLLFAASLAFSAMPWDILGFSNRTYIFCPSSGVSLPPILLQNGPCVPCPDHGFCTDNGELVCDLGFIVQGPECVEDSFVIKAARERQERIIDELQSRAGLFECGEREDAGMNMQQIKEWWATSGIAAAATPIDLSLDFPVWTRVENFLTASARRHEAIDLDPMTGVYHALEPAYTIACHIRLQLYHYKYHLILVGLVLSLLSYVYYSIKRYFGRRRAARELADRLFDFLSEHRGSPIAVDHIRDEFHYRRTDPVWAATMKRVDADSRVRRVREKHGEVYMDAWEWIAKTGRKSITLEHQQTYQSQQQQQQQQGHYGGHAQSQPHDPNAMDLSQGEWERPPASRRSAGSDMIGASNRLF